MRTQKQIHSLIKDTNSKHKNYKLKKETHLLSDLIKEYEDTFKQWMKHHLINF